MKTRKLIGSLGIGVVMSLGGLAVANVADAAPTHAAARPGSGSVSSSETCTLQTIDGTVVGQTPCTLTITSFQRVGNAINAVGTVATSDGTAAFSTPVQLSDPPACSILNLTLGPLDLNLLGLVVHLDTVHLTIDAQPGSGNLLGNLLCAVVHLLDQTPTTALLNTITNLLNQILAAL